MIKRSIISLTFATLLTYPTIQLAESRVHIDYDPKTDMLNLIANDAHLDDILKKLATEIPFKLVLDGEDTHRKVNISLNKKTAEVVKQLVKPDSVILSQSNDAPFKVTNVILLPIGEQSKEEIIRENLRPPPQSDNDEENTQRQALHERRVQRRAQGLGNHKGRTFE